MGCLLSAPRPCWDVSICFHRCEGCLSAPQRLRAAHSTCGVTWSSSPLRGGESTIDPWERGDGFKMISLENNHGRGISFLVNKLVKMAGNCQVQVQGKSHFFWGQATFWRSFDEVPVYFPHRQGGHPTQNNFKPSCLVMPGKFMLLHWWFPWKMVRSGVTYHGKLQVKFGWRFSESCFLNFWTAWNVRVLSQKMVITFKNPTPMRADTANTYNEGMRDSTWWEICRWARIWIGGSWNLILVGWEFI